MRLYSNWQLRRVAPVLSVSVISYVLFSCVFVVVCQGINVSVVRARARTEADEKEEKEIDREELPNPIYRQKQYRGIHHTQHYHIDIYIMVHVKHIHITLDHLFPFYPISIFHVGCACLICDLLCILFVQRPLLTLPPSPRHCVLHG